MASRYARLATSPVPQTEPLNERQVKNNAGGFVFAIDDWARLDRFLVLGSDANTYYQSAKQLTKQNAACVERCLAGDYTRTLTQIVEISQTGRAAKNDAAIFAVALAAVNPDENVRRAAMYAMLSVCRTATHLFQFVTAVRTLGKGWGRGFKRGVAKWYDIRDKAQLSYQTIKYREREGYSHARVIALSGADGRAGGSDEGRKALFRWALGKKPRTHEEADALPMQVKAHLLAMDPKTPKARVLELIRKHRLPWEAVPTGLTTDPEVWAAMLPDMGLTALIRNLGGMTQYGTLAPLSTETGVVIKRLADEDELRRARIHPFNVLVALAVYKSGQSVRGKRSWTPVPAIVDALDKAFYASFKHIVPTGKRTLIGLDVSGSMSSSLMGSPLEVCEGAAAMAMTTMRAESNWHVMAFDTGMRDLGFSAQASLAEVLRKTRNINGGGTDCALPMKVARQKGWDVDVFQVITDNETWAGSQHASQALVEYRRQTGIPAKLVVVGMTATNFSIADPNDAGMLDVVGFDSNAPAIIADFARG